MSRRSRNESRRARRQIAPLDIALGFGALGAIVVLIVSMTAKSILGMPHNANVAALTDAAITSHVMPKSDLGVHKSLTSKVAAAILPSSPAKSIDQMLPVTVSGDWGRLDNAKALTPTPISSGKLSMATYKRGTSTVTVWLFQFGTPDLAGKFFANLADNQQTIHSPTGNQTVTGRLMNWRGNPSIELDTPAATETNSLASTTPGISIAQHMLTWRRGPDVITVASDSESDRNAFATSFQDKL